MMTALPNTENVVPFAAAARPSRLRRITAAVEAERSLSRIWVGRLRDVIKAGRLYDALNDQDRANLRVKPSSVLAVAKSLASPRYPSFWKGGVYARQSAIGADPDVGLSGRQVARIIKLLVASGYLKRADQDERNGRTCLLQPTLPSAANTAERSSVAPAATTLCPTPPTLCQGTPDMVSEESSNLIPNQKADSPLNPPTEPSGNAASGQASKGGKSDACDAFETCTCAKSLGSAACSAGNPSTTSKCEVLPTASFDAYWGACAEPRGRLGFALAEWGKLTVDQQQRACERPARDAWAGNWLRARGFDLEPDIGKPHGAARRIGEMMAAQPKAPGTKGQLIGRLLEILTPYSAEWEAERNALIAAGCWKKAKFMEDQARAGKGWTA